MSNVINNIVKNDTTYAVQDARVDSMKQDFIATYGVTPFTTIEEHYLNGENVAIIKDNQRYEVSDYKPTGVVGEKQMYFSKIYYPYQSAYTAPNAVLDCILVRYTIATSATQYNTTNMEVGKRMYVADGDSHLNISYTSGQCTISSNLSDKQDTLTAGSNITINNNTISATDTTYTAGSNVSINNGVISATDTTYSDATTSASGLMSSADKVKLNGVASGASAVSVSASGTATDEVGYITVNGVEKKLAGGGSLPQPTPSQETMGNNAVVIAVEEDEPLLEEKYVSPNKTITSGTEQIISDTFSEEFLEYMTSVAYTGSKVKIVLTDETTEEEIFSCIPHSISAGENAFLLDGSNAGERIWVLLLTAQNPNTLQISDIGSQTLFTERVGHTLKLKLSSVTEQFIVGDPTTINVNSLFNYVSISPCIDINNEDREIFVNTDIIREEINYPAPPSEDGNYVLKCSVVDYVPTFSWEAQS